MALYKSEGLRIATYANGAPGTAGKGISNIENYYYASTAETLESIPEVGNQAWKKEISDLEKSFNETNKYLWNYELITYTDHSSSDTGRVMIAVYSKDGEEGRGIEGILEFYILTETNQAPLSFPTDSNNNGWTQSPIPIPTSDNPYLWNYEIVNYTTGKDTTAGPTCIGTYGNSITEVKEYYMATDKNVAPTSYTDSRWKETVSGAGQGATKPYLWNYEKTSYSISGDKYTPITLLSASNREIETVTEYYQQLAYNSTSTPSGAIWTDDNHNTNPTVPDDWSTTRAALETGKIMWNMEVIKYAAVDGQGKNLYVATAPAQVGYAGTNGTDGTSPYSVELDNDNVTITTDKDGTVADTLVQEATKTTVSVKEGGTDITSSCYFTWTAKSGNVNLGLKTANGTGTTKGPSTNAIASLQTTTNGATTKYDDATLTVDVYYPDRSKKIGSKILNVSKSKTGATGAAAVVYQLQATPQQINMSNWTSGTTVTFKVLKYEGNKTPTEVTTNYEIKYNSNQTVSNKNYSVPQSFTGQTFSLYINSVLVDSETVTAVKNGDDSIVPGPSTEQVYVYYRTNQKANIPTPAAEAPYSENITNEWTIVVLEATPESPYVYRAELTKKTSSNGEPLWYNGTYPELFRAYIDTQFGISQESRAEFLKMTNFGESGGLVQTKDGIIIEAAGADGKTAIVVDKKKVNIAGWNVTAESLKQGTIGESDSMILSAKGVSYQGNIGGSGPNANNPPKWVITAGEHFGVTNEGQLYATEAHFSGSISSSSIDGKGGFTLNDDGIIANLGFISGWEITNDSLKKGRTLMASGDANWGYASPIRFAVSEENGYQRYKYQTSRKGENGNITFTIDTGTSKFTIESIEFEGIFSTEREELSKTTNNQEITITLENTSFLNEYTFIIIIKVPYGESVSDIFTNITKEFIVLDNGALYATNATIRGHIEATSGNFKGHIEATSSSFEGYIDANEGFIAGWQIAGEQITKVVQIGENAFGRLGLASSADLPPLYVTQSTVEEAKFKVNWDGTLYAMGAQITGNASLTGDFETFGQRNAGTDDYPIIVDVSASIKDGELRIDGTSTYLELSGSSYIATGTDWIYKNDGDFKYQSLPWIQSWSYKLSNYDGYHYIASLGLTSGRGSPSYATDDRLKMMGTWQVAGDLYDSGGIAHTSDKNLKNSINYVDEKYNILFDNLIPRTFKYNNGTSNRLHTGFIAQEAEAAAIIAEIPLQDFAAVCIYKPNDDFEEWSLRYDEFVALNTWQIQKLKPRMSATEQEISELKLKISALEQELENLKNS